MATVDTVDTVLAVEPAAERLGTRGGFIRHLLQERRIGYAEFGKSKFGKHVRIAEGVLAAYIAASAVPTLREARFRFGKAA